MSNYLALNGQRVISGAVSIPYLGWWVADVVLATATVLAASVTLSIGNLSLVGAVIRQADSAGSRSARLVGGAGGWRQPVRAQCYSDPSGVKLSTVLRDTAAAAGESLVLDVADRRIGNAYVRQGLPADEPVPARQVLTHLVGGLFWVDIAGQTHVGANRPSVAVKSPFTLEGWSGAKGRFVVATEAYEEWLPGNTFSNALVPTAQTISLVSHHAENDGRLRTEVLVTP